MSQNLLSAALVIGALRVKILEVTNLLSVRVFLIGRFFLTGLGLTKVICGTGSGSILVPLGTLHLCGSEVHGSSAGISVSPISCQVFSAVISPIIWEQVSPSLKRKRSEKYNSYRGVF